MHELAICQAMLGQVAEIAADRCAASVGEIFIAVGPLSGVEPALLQNAFPIAAAGTIADGARLHIESLPVRVHCRKCAIESEVSANRLLCGQCGTWQTTLVSGDELLLSRVELELQEHARPPDETRIDALATES